MSRQSEIKPGEETLSSVKEIDQPIVNPTKITPKRRSRRQAKLQLSVQPSPELVKISDVIRNPALSVATCMPEQSSSLEIAPEQVQVQSQVQSQAEPQTQIQTQPQSQTQTPIIKYAPSDAEALIVEGMNLARVQDFKAALECFEQATRLSPNHSKAWYNRGMGLVSTGAPKEEALFCFQKALEINPYDAEAWNNKGAVLAMLDNEFDAMVCYERALELKPGYSRAWANMGALYLKIGNRKAAKECFDKSR